MNSVLVDTCVLIDYLRAKKINDSLLTRIFESQKNSLNLYICLVSITELWAGKSMKDTEMVQYVEKLLSKIDLVEVGADIAKKAGILMRDSSYAVSFQDALIAATAIENKMELLTLNKKHFRQIKELSLFEG